jgi:hypothetical protein
MNKTYRAQSGSRNKSNSPKSKESRMAKAFKASIKEVLYDLVGEGALPLDRVPPLVERAWEGSREKAPGNQILFGR